MLTLETGSYREFGWDRFLATSAMKWMYDMAIKDPAKRKEIYASPLQASLDRLRGFTASADTGSGK